MDVTSRVQFIDENVSPSYFRDSDRESFIYVSDMFLTVQGEMPFAGYPALFLRLAGCNRGAKIGGCEGCDTDFRISKAKTFTIKHLTLTLSGMLWNFYSKTETLPLLVVTGGEPLLQMPNLTQLFENISTTLDDLNEAEGKYNPDDQYFLPKLKVQFETNGDYISKVYNDSKTYVISPKGDLLPYLSRLYTWHRENKLPKDIYIRRVVAKNSSIYTLSQEEINELRNLNYIGCLNEVYVSPQTVYKNHEGSTVLDTEQSLANSDYALELCLNTGFKLSFQSHIYAGIK